MSEAVELKNISTSVSALERPTLGKRNVDTGLEVKDGGETAVALPPTDGGFHAWAYLMSAWVLDFLIWGLPFSYGVFLDFYLSSDQHFAGSSSTLIALTGSICNGILYLSSLILLPIISRHPWLKRRVMTFGLVVCVSGLVGAAFVRKPWQLVLTQGVMYSVGGSLLYFPMMTFLFEWFATRKGFANGVLFSGASLGGVILPFIIQALLSRFGRKTTLISLAISLVIFVLPCFPFLRPRLPVTHVVGPRPIDFKFLRRSVFWILFFATLSQGFGAYMPFLYLPKFASDLNLSTTYGTLAVSLANGKSKRFTSLSAPGLIFFGHLSDRFDLRISIILSSIGSASSVFLLWGFSSTLAPLLVFASVYGFLGPSWSALFPRFVSASIGDDPHQSSVLLSIFLAGRGIGNTLSAPISAGLLHPSSMTGRSSFAYGLKGYGPLILFTGTTLLLSSSGVLFRGLGLGSLICEPSDH